MIVADANLVLYVVLPSELTSQAEQARAKDREWVVPPLFRSEMLNVLSTHVRNGYFDRDQAMAYFRRCEALVRVHGEFSRGQEIDIMNRSIQANCTTYDAEYVVLAEQLDVELVTADQELSRAFPDRVILLSEYIRSAK